MSKGSNGVKNIVVGEAISPVGHDTAREDNSETGLAARAERHEAGEKILAEFTDALTNELVSRGIKNLPVFLPICFGSVFHQTAPKRPEPVADPDAEAEAAPVVRPAAPAAPAPKRRGRAPAEGEAADLPPPLPGTFRSRNGISLSVSARYPHADDPRPFQADAAKRKSAESHLGVPLKPEHRAAIGRPRVGVKRGPHSEEWRAKLSAAQKGKPRHTPEQRAAIGEAQRRRWAQRRAEQERTPDAPA